MNSIVERTKVQPKIKLKTAETKSDPQPFRWTRDEYYRMAELGFFEGKRVELIGGEIVETSPMKTAHATALSSAIEVLMKFFNKNYVVRVQSPLSFSSTNEPEPDIAVVEGSVRDFTESHPANAVLLIKISDTTLIYDQTRKARLYAKNKIQDYWIVNLKDKKLEIYRRPIKDNNAAYSYSYGEIQIFTEKDSVTPLAKSNTKIKVSDLLP